MISSVPNAKLLGAAIVLPSVAYVPLAVIPSDLPMVGMTVAVAVSVEEAAKAGKF